MTTTNDLLLPPPADRFGRAVAARLSAGTDELSYEVRERLRAARPRPLAAPETSRSKASERAMVSRWSRSD